MVTKLDNLLWPAGQWLRYAKSAAGPHAVHSPFVFDLLTRIIRNQGGFNPPAYIEEVRETLLRDHTRVAFTDFGAGALKRPTTRKISSVARISLQPRRYAQLLYRLSAAFRPNTILELGTSLGISTLYLAEGSPDAEVFTLEGDPGMRARAEQLFASAGKHNIRVVGGNFDDTLPVLLNGLPALDMAYLDGNHTEEATLRYFNLLAPVMSRHGLIIVDDIHWSPGMKRAWEEIIQDERVQYSMDLFRLGLVFFNQVRVRQHFVLKF